MAPEKNKAIGEVPPTNTEPMKIEVPKPVSETVTDPLDEFMVDKVEITEKEKQLDKELESISEDIKALRRRDYEIIKHTPKPSSKNLEELKKQKEVLLKLLKENKKRQKTEEKSIRSERLILLKSNPERDIIKRKIKILEDRMAILFREKHIEFKKRKSYKDGKLVKQRTSD